MVKLHQGKHFCMLHSPLFLTSALNTVVFRILTETSTLTCEPLRGSHCFSFCVFSPCVPEKKKCCGVTWSMLPVLRPHHFHGFIACLHVKPMFVPVLSGKSFKQTASTTDVEGTACCPLASVCLHNQADSSGKARNSTFILSLHCGYYPLSRWVFEQYLCD